VDSISTKLDGLQTTVDSLRLKLSAKDAVLSRMEQDNSKLSKLINELSTVNENLQQELRRDNVIVTGIAPSVAEVTAVGLSVSTSQATMIKALDFCHDILQLPQLKSDDISAAYFLPLPKPIPGRSSPAHQLIVRFTRRGIRDEVFARRKLLKTHNQEHHTAYYINEDLVKSKRKLLGLARSALSANKLTGVWTSSGSVYIKLLSNRVVAIRTVDELNNFI
jgi:hypothetical protein